MISPHCLLCLEPTVRKFFRQETHLNFLAYPAEYRSSGVMTFLVGPNGIVYQKDLGADTVSQAGAIQSFEIDTSWIRQ